MLKFELNATNIGLVVSLLLILCGGIIAFNNSQNEIILLKEQLKNKAEISYVQRIEERLKESELFNKQVNEQIVELKIMLQVFIAEVRTERKRNKL